MDTISIAVAGFSALACIQIVHLRYFAGGTQPLDLFPYPLALFVVPSSFYFSAAGRFSRRSRCVR